MKSKNSTRQKKSTTQQSQFLVKTARENVVRRTFMFWFNDRQRRFVYEDEHLSLTTTLINFQFLKASFSVRLIMMMNTSINQKTKKVICVEMKKEEISFEWKKKRRTMFDEKWEQKRMTFEKKKTESNDFWLKSIKNRNDVMRECVIWRLFARNLMLIRPNSIN
jgi:hypothetical protein